MGSRWNVEGGKKKAAGIAISSIPQYNTIQVVMSNADKNKKVEITTEELRQMIREGVHAGVRDFFEDSDIDLK